YPQREFPYDDLVAENHRRGRDMPEYELLDTGIFDEDRYWDIGVDYAKAGPEDICARVTVRNAGPDEATLHVLPTVWFRNVWPWGIDAPTSAKPSLSRGSGASIVTQHNVLGRRSFGGSGSPQVLCCDNETNVHRLWNVEDGPSYPKDGINDHVLHGAATVNPNGEGTKGALWYRLTVPAGETVEIRLRLSDADTADLGDMWEQTMATRQREADAFYKDLNPELDGEHARVLRQSMAGMLWSKQFYHYNVIRWL